MKYPRQEPPNAVQIELVEGCNLRCEICGLNGIRGKANDYKHMKAPTLQRLMDQMVELKWNPRVEFAMHGEPTMHHNYVAMIAVARGAAPKLQLMMTSNGGGLLGGDGPLENIRQLFASGLNVLALDDYEHAKIVPKIRDKLAKNTVDGVLAWKDGMAVDVYEYPENPKGNPHARDHISVQKLVFVRDIVAASKGTHSLINNHAGAGAPPNEKGAGKRCAKPFRELSVRWDGEVACCCNDWRGSYKAGNVVKDGLDAVWNGKAMGAIRVALYHGRRDMMKACSGCDAISYRVGLLPDKLGKEDLPAPDASVRRDIAAAEKGEPLTKPVLRPWEKPDGRSQAKG
jgi:hypothetical protein